MFESFAAWWRRSPFVFPPPFQRRASVGLSVHSFHSPSSLSTLTMSIVLICFALTNCPIRIVGVIQDVPVVTFAAPGTGASHSLRAIKPANDALPAGPPVVRFSGIAQSLRKFSRVTQNERIRDIDLRRKHHKSINVVSGCRPLHTLYILPGHFSS